MLITIFPWQTRLGKLALIPDQSESGMPLFNIHNLLTAVDTVHLQASEHKFRIKPRTSKEQ